MRIASKRFMAMKRKQSMFRKRTGLNNIVVEAAVAVADSFVINVLEKAMRAARRVLRCAMVDRFCLLV